MRKHLRRHERVWVEQPTYFITTCTLKRRPILTDSHAASTLINEWRFAHQRHGWAIGRYVIMPDHVHFCAPELDAKTLPMFLGLWKEWSSKAIKSAASQRISVWQKEFFDHLLRSFESYDQKWNYVRDNPVRAGLVEKADEWPWQGEIEELRL